MAQPPQSPPTATGLIWAAAVFAGAGVGVAYGQPSAGFVGGVVLGGLIALGLWWRDRERG